MPAQAKAWKTVAGMVAVFICALLLWLWTQPMGLIHAQFTRQRMSAGLSLHQAQAAGHRWTYAERKADQADAPTVVMIHGFTGSKENGYPLAAQLRGHYHLIIPDLPGWGDSERKPGEDYGFDAQNRRLAEFIRRYVKQPGSELILLGHSMGGGIAALTAADHPELVDRVGLLAASGVLLEGNDFGAQALAGKNPFAVDDIASLQNYLDILFHRPEARPWIPWPASKALIEYRKQQAPFEQEVLDRIGRSDERFLPGKAAAHIQQPSLLLWCQQDRVIDVSAQQVYAAQLPQAINVTLNDCGHMSLMERPIEVAAAVEYLIKRGKPR